MPRDPDTGRAQPRARSRKPAPSRDNSKVLRRQVDALIKHGAPVAHKRSTGVQATNPALQRKRAPIRTSTGDVRKAAARDKQGRVVVLRPPSKPKPKVIKGIKGELQGQGLSALGLNHIASKAAGALPTKGVGGLLSRAAQDIINLPAQIAPSVYVPVAAAVESIEGRPARLKRLVHDIQTTDPIYAGAASAPVLHNLLPRPKGAKSAAKLISEHPGFAAVEIAGAKGAVGHGITRAQRVAGRAPTLRESARVPGTNIVEPRRYSKDALARPGQRMNEQRKISQATDLRQQAATLHAQHGPHSEADVLMAKANYVDPRVASDAYVRTRAARRAEVNRAVSHSRQQRLKRDVRATLGAKPSAHHTLAAQGIVDFSADSLRGYQAKLRALQPTLTPKELKVNRHLDDQITAALAAKHVPDELRAEVRAYRELAAPLADKLVNRGMLPAAAAESAKLTPYAVRHMEGVVPGDAGPVHTRTGARVSPTAIRLHMAAHDVPEPVHVPHEPPRSVSPVRLAPPNETAKPRTGAETIKGLMDAHPLQTLAATPLRHQGLLDADAGYSSMLNEFAHEGRFKTSDAARSAAADLHATSGIKFRPVRERPAIDANGDVGEAIQGALRGTDGTDGSGDWRLIPEAAARELEAQAKPEPKGPIAGTLRIGSQTFRRTVLATSIPWFTGNVTEASLRAALAGAGPQHLRLAHNVLSELEKTSPRLADEMRSKVSIGHYGSADRALNPTDLTQFEGTKMEPVARALSSFWAKPHPAAVAKIWNAWSDLVFQQLNGRLESKFQTAMLGKALRDSPLMEPGLRRISETAVQQAARGLRDTNEQAAMGEMVARMYGRYSGFPADMRWSIAQYTPFVPWTINAVKFITSVLPRDHPVVTALIAASVNATTEWRKDHGLDLFIRDQLPGFLQGSIPMSKGRHLQASRYTPFGAFGDPLETAGSAVLPQLSGVLAAFKGEDWKGAKLRNPDGSPAGIDGKAKAAAMSLLDATVPALSTLKRASKKGPEALLPFRPIAAAKSKPKALRPAPVSAAGGGGLNLDLGGPAAGQGLNLELP